MNDFPQNAQFFLVYPIFVIPFAAHNHADARIHAVGQHVCSADSWLALRAVSWRDLAVFCDIHWHTACNRRPGYPWAQTDSHNSNISYSSAPFPLALMSHWLHPLDVRLAATITAEILTGVICCEHRAAILTVPFVLQFTTFSFCVPCQAYAFAYPRMLDDILNYRIPGMSSQL